MNRREAIFAMLCAIAGRQSIAQESGSIVVQMENMKVYNTFNLSLDKGAAFVFEHGGQSIKLTGDEIWAELSK